MAGLEVIVLIGLRSNGFNPVRQDQVLTARRGVKIDRELPMREEYSRFVAAIVDAAESPRREEPCDDD